VYTQICEDLLKTTILEAHIDMKKAGIRSFLMALLFLKCIKSQKGKRRMSWLPVSKFFARRQYKQRSVTARRSIGISKKYYENHSLSVIQKHIEQEVRLQKFRARCSSNKK
jgi:hypothetical protein